MFIIKEKAGLEDNRLFLLFSLKVEESPTLMLARASPNQFCS